MAQTTMKDDEATSEALATTVFTQEELEVRVTKGQRSTEAESTQNIVASAKQDEQPKSGSISEETRVADEQFLFRFVKMIKEYLLVFQELHWGVYRNIVRFKTVESSLVLIGTQCDTKEERLLSSSSMSSSQRFPYDAFNDKLDREAALTYMACRQAIVEMRPWVNDMLQAGLLTEAVEIAHLPKNIRKPVLLCDGVKFPSDPANVPHVVMKVTMRSGDTWAIDLTAAQYGHKETMLPWNEYVEMRVLKPIYMSPDP